MTPSDAALLEKTAAGDRDALESLVSRYAPAVFRYARAITGEEAAAEDVLQETFLSVWKNAGSFRQAAPARSWILTIARHAAFRQFRRHAGEPDEMESLASLGADAGWAAQDPRLVEQLSNRELVAIGLRGLSPEEREVLVLREIDGLSGEEAAAILGTSLAAMKSRLHRARLRFLKNVREKLDA